MSEAHFGATLRLLRVNAGFGLRELAGLIGVSSAYLSRVENGHDPAPTPDRLAAIADVLGVPRAVVLELARQTGPAVAGYLQRVPAAGGLLLDLARRDLTTGQIGRIKAFVDREFPGRERPRPRRARLTDLIGPERVVVGLSCPDLESLVEIAVARLPVVAGVTRREVARRILARERDAPTAIGNGFVVPHVLIAGAPRAAVLLTLRRPLAIATLDRVPIRVAMVLLGDEPGPAHLDALARVARLAGYDATTELCAARSADRVLAAIESIESLW